MKLHKLTILLWIFSFTLGCSTGVATPSAQPGLNRMAATATPLSTVTATATLPATATPSITPEPLPPDAPKGCVNLTEAPSEPSTLNGLLVLIENNFSRLPRYFLFDPKTNQLRDIETGTQLSWDSPGTNVKFTMISPNNKFIEAYLGDKDRYILGTGGKVINTYGAQDRGDWSADRWLDNERMVFQYGFSNFGIFQNESDASSAHTYKIVVFNPFTGEQENLQFPLPDPSVMKNAYGDIIRVNADIAPSLKQALYNDQDQRLILWDLDAKKEIASLPVPADIFEVEWSPDRTRIAVRAPTSDSAPNELFMLDMDGKVTKLTDFQQKYPFANITAWPSWSPDGHYIAYGLKISNDSNPVPKDLREWLAITDITTLTTQTYCLSGGGGWWSPDGTQIIVNTKAVTGEIKSVLVNLKHQTRTTLDLHGLFVAGWLAP
jgi:hypothetical protein